MFAKEEGKYVDVLYAVKRVQNIYVQSSIFSKRDTFMRQPQVERIKVGERPTSET